MCDNLSRLKSSCDGRKEKSPMPRSQYLTTLRFTSAAFLSLMFVAVALHTGAEAQQTATPSEVRERGIELYKQGDAKNAIAALRTALKHDREDGEAWHYLGLALVVDGDRDEARGAFEKAARIRLSNLRVILPASGSDGAKSARPRT